MLAELGDDELATQVAAWLRDVGLTMPALPADRDAIDGVTRRIVDEHGTVAGHLGNRPHRRRDDRCARGLGLEKVKAVLGAFNVLSNENVGPQIGSELRTKGVLARYVYIHGTPEERKLGTPASYGCIRMGSADIIVASVDATFGLPEIDRWPVIRANATPSKRRFDSAIIPIPATTTATPTHPISSTSP